MNSRLKVSLFGRLNVRWGAEGTLSIDSLNAQKLFSYLLLFRKRAHNRNKLAGLLWSNSRASRAKAYLRKALWQLQNALEDTKSQPLLVDSDWLQVNPQAPLWLDLSVFERAFLETEDIPGASLDAEAMEQLERAVALYRGELLEGYYDEWCLLERERLLRMYLIMLDKLAAFSEANNRYDAGIKYAMLMLRHSNAHEGAHRRLMRLHYAAGDRTIALLQYKRCKRVLAEELDVAPSARTTALYEQIRKDWHPSTEPAIVQQQAPISHRRQLRQIKATLEQLQQQVRRDIEAVEELLEKDERR